MSWLEDAESVACLLTGSRLVTRATDRYVFELPSSATSKMRVVAEREPPGWLDQMRCYYVMRRRRRPPPSCFTFTPRIDRVTPVTSPGASFGEVSVVSTDLPGTRLLTESGFGETDIDPIDIGRALAHLGHAVATLGQPPIVDATRDDKLPTSIPDQQPPASALRICSSLSKATPPSTMLVMAAGYAAGHDVSPLFTRLSGPQTHDTMDAQATTHIGGARLDITMTGNRVTARLVPPPIEAKPGSTLFETYGNFHPAMHFSKGAWTCGMPSDPTCTVDHVAAVVCRVAAAACKQAADAKQNIAEE
jgi:hypothetical protein